MSAKAENTRDARIKVYELIRQIDSTSVTTVEKRRKLLTDLVKRSEWESVCHDQELVPIINYVVSYTKLLNNCDQQ